MSAPTPSAEAALSLEIIDALMVVAARGWREIVLAMQRNERGEWRVGEITTQLAGERALAKPTLGLEPGVFHGVLNEALGDLARLANVEPTNVRVTRREDAGVEIALEGDGARVLSKHAVTPEIASNLMFSEPMLEAFLAAEPEIVRCQANLAEVFTGHDDWSFDAATGLLRLSKGVLPWATMRASPVGSYAYESESWLWAWANDAFSPRSTPEVCAVRDAARSERGMSVLLRPTFPCTEAFALRLAGFAALRMNAHGIYGAAYGPGVMFLAVMQAPSRDKAHRASS